MSDKTSTPASTAALALVATGGALAGWWWQSRKAEADLEERTRARLRPWGHR